MSEFTNENPPSENLPGINPETTGGNPGSVSPKESTLEAGRAALDAIVPKPKNKGGRPRKHGLHSTQNPVSVASMGNGSNPTCVDPQTTAESNVPALPPEPAVNYEEIAEAYADPILDLLGDLSAAYQRLKTFRSTKNQTVADIVATEQRTIPENPRKLMRQGIIGLAKKHKVDLSQFPETSLGAGLLMWQVSAHQSTKQAIETYFRQQQQQKAA